MSRDLIDLNVAALREKMLSGQTSVREVAEAFITRCEALEQQIHALAWFDADHVRAQADDLDALRARGGPLGPLFGLPVALKDIIDTQGIATENGTVLDRGRIPSADSAVAERLRAAGAIMFAKTVTTELAFLEPSQTRNPHNLDHTPGGSSAGSAAGTAARMFPLAVGTQTGGSVIRPGAFCGITGFKPSFGVIPRRGVLNQSPSLDTIGTYARDVDGAALLAHALAGPDHGDRDSLLAPRLPLHPGTRAFDEARPRLALLRTPWWDRAADETIALFEELEGDENLGLTPIELPHVFADAVHHRALINQVEMAVYYEAYVSRGEQHLSAHIRGFMRQGDSHPATALVKAHDHGRLLEAHMGSLMDDFDAILCPSATGYAPPLSERSTGDPVFNGAWTFAGVPAITIPVPQPQGTLPLGIQLIGRKFGDAALVASARWLERYLGQMKAGAAN